VTTEAVLTQSTHLLGRIVGGAIACLDFVLSGLGTNLVMTTDQRDFSIYRIAGRKRFKICV
jgi:hypothetical protein